MNKIQNYRKQAIKFQNLKEHTSTLQKELGTKLQLHNDYLEKTGSVLDTVERVESKEILLDKEINRIRDKERELQNKESLLVSREEEFHKYEDSVLKRLEAQISRIEGEKSSLKNEAVEYAKIEEKLQEAIKYHIDELKRLEGQFQASESMYRSQISNYKGLTHAHEKKLSELSDAKISLQREVDALNTAIKEKREENKEEAVKIANAYNGLYLKEDQLNKKERNLLILKLRLAKILEKLYPGQNIDNLI